jgi:hypothetical protein
MEQTKSNIHIHMPEPEAVDTILGLQVQSWTSLIVAGAALFTAIAGWKAKQHVQRKRVDNPDYMRIRKR